MEMIEINKKSGEHGSADSGNEVFVSEENEEDKIELFEKSLYLAKFCVENEKYEDAIFHCDAMTRLKDSELTEEERDIFVTAYRFYISKLRSSWRALFFQEGKGLKEKFGSVPLSAIHSEIRRSVEEKIVSYCEKFIAIVQQHIGNNIISDEGKSFFYKVMADHYRYLAEISEGDKFNSYKLSTESLYKEAKRSSKQLSAVNVIRLGVCLNFAVFRYEILNENEKAIKSAQKCLNRALLELKELSNNELQDRKMKEAMAIIEVINQNLKEWSKDEEDEEEESVE